MKMRGIMQRCIISSPFSFMILQFHDFMTVYCEWYDDNNTTEDFILSNPRSRQQNSTKARSSRTVLPWEHAPRANNLSLHISTATMYSSYVNSEDNQECYHCIHNGSSTQSSQKHSKKSELNVDRTGTITKNAKDEYLDENL